MCSLVNLSPKAKLDKLLGVKIESIHYTQGYYDFVDIVDAPNPEAVLAFSVWYATQGLGRVQSMPGFDAKSFRRLASAGRRRAASIAYPEVARHGR
jgi:uncharacterized protein with GYD domain